jgi:hypothetical protein
MAAFGLLRVCSQIAALGEVHLFWKMKTDWTAVLTTRQEITKDALIDLLADRQRGRSGQDFLSWNDDIKVPPLEFAGHLRAMMEEADSTCREQADFFAAYGSELVTARSTDDVKPTAFHMTAGQQQFLKGARELALSLDPDRPRRARETLEQVRDNVRQAFSEALFGPWRYRDSYHSLGWDPSREALHALSAIAPTKSGATSVRAAVWLAFESLPLFPCMANRKKLVTRGFDLDNKAFYWPVWDVPVTIDTLRSLLATSALVDDNEMRGELSARGVKAVFRSARTVDANGRGIFRDAVFCVQKPSSGF